MPGYGDSVTWGYLGVDDPDYEEPDEFGEDIEPDEPDDAYLNYF